MKPERVINIREKLPEIGVPLESLSLGDFSYIGEATARKMRDPQSELWRTAGSHFSPNLERGLLIYSLITKYKLKSYLEIGFGRGYSAICAAKAFADLNNDGQVMVIEPQADDNHMQMLAKMFPPAWMNRIQVARAKSEHVLPKLQDSYDLVYVDGDHTVGSVRSDWEGVKDHWSCFCLFDDWHITKGTDPMIQVHEALEQVEQPEGTKCELIVMDRRVFFDDRRWPDEKVRYGQLLLTRESALEAKLKEGVVAETWDW